MNKEKCIFVIKHIFLLVFLMVLFVFIEFSAKQYVLKDLDALWFFVPVEIILRISPVMSIFYLFTLVGLYITLSFFSFLDKRLVFLVFGLTFASFILKWYMFFVLAWVLLLYGIISLQVQRWLTFSLFIIIQTITILLMLSSMKSGYGLPVADQNTELFYCYAVFLAIIPIRIFYFWFESAVKGKNKKVSFLDYMGYLFYPVYFLILPFIIFFPKPNYFKATILQSKIKREKFLEGERFILWGLLFLAAKLGLFFVFQLMRLDIEKNTSILGDAILTIKKTVALTLTVCGYGNMLIGFSRVMGCNFKATSKGSFIQNLNIQNVFSDLFPYFKEFVLEVFWVPLSFLLKKFNQYAAIIFVCSLSFSGAAMLSAILLGFDYCTVLDSYHFANQYDFSDLSILSFYHSVYEAGIWGLAAGFVLSLQMILNKVQKKPQVFFENKVWAVFLKFFSLILLLVCFYFLFRW